jgi:hypothetical protein
LDLWSWIPIDRETDDLPDIIGMFSQLSFY